LITQDSADLIDHRRVVGLAVRIHAPVTRRYLAAMLTVSSLSLVSNRVGTHPPGGRTGQ
jgi:hypothetical protein